MQAAGVLRRVKELLSHLSEEDVRELPGIKRGHQKMLMKIARDLRGD